MKTTLFEAILTHFFGRKYYANIINTRGTFNTQICSYIFRTREEANNHRRTLETLPSFQYLETISFRSRRNY